MNDVVETYRAEIVKSLFRAPSFSLAWDNLYRRELDAILGPSPDHKSILELGVRMREVFKRQHTLQRGEGPTRTQAELSISGNAWESLVCWYLNLGLLGTSAVVAKQRAHVPKQVRDALSVTVQDSTVNSEADLVAVGFAFNDEPLLTGRSRSVEAARVALEGTLNKPKTLVGVVQCKTNWKDNVQSVMLWNAIYNQAAKAGAIEGLSVGMNGHNLRDFDRFFYSFVTVPTNEPNHTSTLAPVTRLATLSGKKYWAAPPVKGVARNISEIFRDAACFQSVTPNWDANLDRELSQRNRPEFHVSVLGWNK